MSGKYVGKIDGQGKLRKIFCAWKISEKIDEL